MENDIPRYSTAITSHKLNMNMKENKLSRRRQQQRWRWKWKRASSSSLVMAETGIAIASVAVMLLLVVTCCQAADSLNIAENGNNDISISSNSKIGRRRRRRRQLMKEGSIRGVADVNDPEKVPTTFLIKFKDKVAQARSLEIHHSSRQFHQQRRESRGDDDEREHPRVHERTKWQSRAKSISSISDERHIAIVDMDTNPDDNSGEAAASTMTEMYNELIADDDVEVVEEDFIMYKYSYDRRIDAYVNNQNEENSNLYLETTSFPSSVNRQLLKRSRRLAEAKQYGIDLTQSSSVWSHTLSNPSSYPNTPVKVCIIDTGYDVTHEDLPKENITGTRTSYGDYLVDGDGHGTHVAGVIGAVGWNSVGIVGVNPDPTKFSFHISKALNRDGFGTASSVLKGIRGCIDSGAKIITMSLGGGPASRIFRNIYEEAYDKGVLSFAAAGNLGLLQDDFPASYPTVVSVGAADTNGNRASFSNWNDQLELMGPGVNIMSTYPDNAYGALSGTSMATPFVAGVAALIWGYFPQCTNQQIRNVLAVTAKPMAADGGRCDRKTGFGLVQAMDAFNMLHTFGCDAGGEKLFDPPSKGAVGGCNQPLANMTKFSIFEPSLVSSTGVNCQKLVVTLLTDGYAYETSWELTRVDNGTIIRTGPLAGDQFQDNTMYSSPVIGCLDPGSYEFTIYDKFGDGLNQPGYYSLKLNGNILVTNSAFGSSETTSFIINATAAQLDARQPDQSWTSILLEAFDKGFGNFIDGGVDAAYVDSRFGRNGLVMVKSGRINFDQASILSNIQFDSSRGYTQFMVVFTYYASNTGIDDGFCLDYQGNASSSWTEAKCWKNGMDFDNRRWYEDESFVFKTNNAGIDSSASISIRFRGYSTDITNRIFFDQIEIFAST